MSQHVYVAVGYSVAMIWRIPEAFKMVEVAEVSTSNGNAPVHTEA